MSAEANPEGNASREPVTVTWVPTASDLAARASLLRRLRAFFDARGVLEVETPLLCRDTVTDPSLQPLSTGDRWLQTSPEYAMKRLLAAGSGPIFQICKAFRAGEQGALHNPEFSLLEWYRPGFTMADMIREVGELASEMLGFEGWQTLTYRELFQRYLDLDPHTAEQRELADCVKSRLDYQGRDETEDIWLNLLLSQVIEPQLAGTGPLFVVDFPASQAALARVRQVGESPVAERFELYVDGVELANGYRELTDASEQRRRFEQDNAELRRRGEPERPVDERLLAALEAGLPDCSGVALGIDRLLMLQQSRSRVADVLSFDWSNA